MTDYEKFVYMAKAWYNLTAGDVFDDEVEAVNKLLRKERLIDKITDEWIEE